MAVNAEISRPILRYHGGKYLLSPWIISHFPEHRIYVEPFGGAASVLLRKKRTYAEIYNDADGSVVNLFKVVRDRGPEIIDKLRNTPFAREEFKLSYEPCTDTLESARRMVVRSFMGFGSASASGRKTGFRSNSHRSGTTPAMDWKNYPDALEIIVERLQGVVIENRDYQYICNQHDRETTLHYLDPPYVLDTRHNGQSTVSYNYEMSNADHLEFCKYIQSLIGYVVVSGYDNDIYNDNLSGWSKVSKNWYGDGAVKRIECLWINKRAKSQLAKQLF